MERYPPINKLEQIARVLCNRDGIRTGSLIRPDDSDAVYDRFWKMYIEDAKAVLEVVYGWTY